ncbi:hypothetical protein GCK32_017048 [Trichostrongylus colubriformis]|uniref:PIN domain-containing protein n=1 Tax=Trichostrongylus colubriformis TaxID=6319 RepID=A0AAN8G2P5_TRICO
MQFENIFQSFAPVDGFVTSSTEDVNDDFILKCAYRMKTLLEAREECWETVFITNDQVLSLKAHANKIPCYNGKEAKAILMGDAPPTHKRTPDDTVAVVENPAKKATSTDEMRVSPSGSCSARTKRKDSIPVASERQLSHLSKKKIKELCSKNATNDTADMGEMTALIEFSKIWNGLVSLLRKRLKKCSTKERKDILRLREVVSW